VPCIIGLVFICLYHCRKLTIRSGTKKGESTRHYLNIKVILKQRRKNIHQYWKLQFTASIRTSTKTTVSSALDACLLLTLSVLLNARVLSSLRKRSFNKIGYGRHFCWMGRVGHSLQEKRRTDYERTGQIKRRKYGDHIMTLQLSKPCQQNRKKKLQWALVNTYCCLEIDIELSRTYQNKLFRHWRMIKRFFKYQEYKYIRLDINDILIGRHDEFRRLPQFLEFSTSY